MSKVLELREKKGKGSGEQKKGRATDEYEKKLVESLEEEVLRKVALMEEIGLPYAYHHFVDGESPEPPFAVFLYPGSHNFSADGKVYFKAKRLNIEIYTDLKNIDLEQKTEAVLELHGIFYEKSEV